MNKLQLTRTKKNLTIAIITISLIAAMSPELVEQPSYFQQAKNSFSNFFKNDEQLKHEEWSKITREQDDFDDISNYDNDEIASITTNTYKDTMSELHNERIAHKKQELKNEGKSTAEINHFFQSSNLNASFYGMTTPKSYEQERAQEMEELQARLKEKNQDRAVKRKKLKM